MRRSLPNWFIRTRAPGWPLTFSKRRAGPPAFGCRCRVWRRGRRSRPFRGGADVFADAAEFAGLVEFADPFAKIGVRHVQLLVALRGGGTPSPLLLMLRYSIHTT